MPNPEIPLLRTSERTLFKRCPQAWYWSVVERLRLNVPESGPLWFGSCIHICLAEFYIPGKKRGRPLLDTWKEVTKNSYQTMKVQQGWGDEERAEFVDVRALGREMLTYYMDVTHGDPNWDVIAPEQRFSILIPYPKMHPLYGHPNAMVRYLGTFDLVVHDEEDGLLKVVDHKTAKTLPSSYDLAILELDDQAGSYITLSTQVLRNQGLIGQTDTVRGMVYNYLVKRSKDDRPQNENGQYLNKNGSVSKVQPPDPFLRHQVTRTKAARIRQVERIQAEAFVMGQVRDGNIPVLKAPSKMNCAFCEFKELCELDENDGDTEYMKANAFRQYDPYADHRDGAENSKSSAANKEKTGVR